MEVRKRAQAARLVGGQCQAGEKQEGARVGDVDDQLKRDTVFTSMPATIPTGVAEANPRTTARRFHNGKSVDSNVEPSANAATPLCERIATKIASPSLLGATPSDSPAIVECLEKHKHTGIERQRYREKGREQRAACQERDRAREINREREREREERHRDRETERKRENKERHARRETEREK